MEIEVLIVDVLCKIKSLMEKADWTEYKLAKESNLSQSTISNMFVRNTLPTIPTLENICNAFNISLSDFFLDDKEKNEQKQLISKFSQLNKEQKRLVMRLIESIK